MDILPGCRLYPEYLSLTRQRELLELIRGALAKAPLFTPSMPRTGKPFSVRMSNMGPLGWVSDKEGGYRYQQTHPKTGQCWPTLPDLLLDLWNKLITKDCLPEACLINYYDAKARMGLHRDEDEQARDIPILSISLGNTARFRLGGLERKAPTNSFELKSGDILVLEPPLRMAYHGIDRIIPGTSTLLSEGGRINLTLRRVNPTK